MNLSILAYVAGVLSILSPCILPVLPFIFCRIGQPFMRTGSALCSLAWPPPSRASRRSPPSAAAGRWRPTSTDVSPHWCSSPFSPLHFSPTGSPNISLGHWWRSASVCRCKALLPLRAPGRFALGRPRRRHGIAVGALRWPDPWPRPDGRRAQWRERQDLARATGIRPRRSDILGWSSPAAGCLQSSSGLSRGRMAAPRFGRCRASRRGHRRYGLGHAASPAGRLRQYDVDRRDADRLD